VPSTIEYAIHSYVDEWYWTDRGARRALTYVPGHNYKEAALEQLGKFLRVYGIARNFPTAYGGSGDPLLRLMEQAKFEGDVNAAYVAFFRALEQQYKRKLYSAASKLLWVRFGSPFRLYDSYADRWLRHKGHAISTDESTWYGDYCDDWQQEFNECRDAIRDDCQELSGVKKFFVPHLDDESELESLLQQGWFHERVFDHYISWAEDPS
jgi:hypothetical protein